MQVNTEALESLQSEALTGTFYRYIRTRYADKPLSTNGAFVNGGRYNVAGSFAALYLGFNLETCEAEVSQGILAGVPLKRGAFTVWEYEASLSFVVRLDDPAIQAQIGVTDKDITISGNHWTASQIGE